MDAWTRKAKDIKGLIQECKDASVNWHSLAPFFASRGYHLYDYPSLREGAVPPAHPQHTPATVGANDPYPHARTISAEDLAFPFIQVLRATRLSLKIPN